MKQLRKLKREHKQQLTALGLNWKEFGCVSDDGSIAVLANRQDLTKTVTVETGGSWRRK